MNLVQLSFNRMRALAKESDEPRKDLFKSITNEGLKKDFGLIDEKASTLEVGEEYQIQSYIQKIQSTIQNLIESYTNGNSSINESKDLLAKYNDLALYLNSKVKYGSLSIKEQNKINQELESIIPLVQELQFLAERLKISYASVYKQLYENLKMNMYKPITLTKETKDILISKTRGAYNIGGVENLVKKWDESLKTINNLTSAPVKSKDIANARNEFVVDMSEAPEWDGKFTEIMVIVQNVRELIDRFNKSTDIKEKNDISQEIIQSKSDVELVVEMIDSLRKGIERDIRKRTFRERMALKKEEKTKNLVINILDANRNRVKIEKEEERKRMEEEERKRMDEERERKEEEGKKKITNLIGKNIFRKRINTRLQKRKDEEMEALKINNEFTTKIKADLANKQLEYQGLLSELEDIETRYPRRNADGSVKLTTLPAQVKARYNILLKTIPMEELQIQDLLTRLEEIETENATLMTELSLTTPPPLDFGMFDPSGKTASTSATKDLKKRLDFETPSTGDVVKPEVLEAALQELKGYDIVPSANQIASSLQQLKASGLENVNKDQLIEMIITTRNPQIAGEGKPKRKMAKQSKKQIEWRSKVKKFMDKNKCSMKEPLIQLKK
jgi:hypothetical protein